MLSQRKPLNGTQPIFSLELKTCIALPKDKIFMFFISLHHMERKRLEIHIEAMILNNEPRIIP